MRFIKIAFSCTYVDFDHPADDLIPPGNRSRMTLWAGPLAMRSTDFPALFPRTLAMICQSTQNQTLQAFAASVLGLSGTAVARRAETALAALLALSATASATAGIPVDGYSEVIAAADTDTPNGDGVYLDFGLPILNTNSQVGFFAEIDSRSNQGVFLGEWIQPDTGPNPILTVARVEDLLPGNSGQITGLVDNLTLTDFNSGLISFAASTNGNSETGLFFGGNGQSGANPYVVQGDNAPPPIGGSFSGFFDPAYNNAGQTAFRATVSDSQVGNAQGLFYTDLSGNLAAYAVGNTVTPDGDTLFGTFSAPSLNDNGTVTFRATRNGFAGGPAGQGIYLAFASGNVVDVAHTGDSSPDDNGDFQTFGVPSINQNDSVVFSATLNGTSSTSGLYGATANAGLFTIRRAGDTAPDGSQFVSFGNNVRLNSNDDFAFSAFLNTEETGLYRSASGAILELAQTGSSTPYGGVYGTFGARSMSDTGAVAFYSELDGSGPAEGVFISDGLDTVGIVSGQQIDGFGKILKINLASGDAGQSPINDRNQVAYRAQTDEGVVFVGLFTPDLHYRRPSSGFWSSQSNWTLTTRPDEVHRVFIDPDNGLRVIGPSSAVTVLSLSIGNGASGTGALELQPNGLIKTLEGTTITDDGELAGNGTLSGGPVVLLRGGRVAPGTSSASSSPASAASDGNRNNPRGGVGAPVLSIDSDFCILWTGVGEAPVVEIDFTNDGFAERIDVSGSAKLGGKLSIRFPDPMNPPLDFGDEAVIIDSNALEGTFDSLEGLDLDGTDGTATPVIYDTVKGDVKVVSTVAGDANGDFIVDLQDLDILGAHWGGGDSNWTKGDFNNDQATDLGDLDLLGQNWGFGSAFEIIPFEQALNTHGWDGNGFVPEPGTAMLVGLGSLMGFRRRR